MKVLNIIGCPNKKDFNFDIHNSVKEFCNKNKVEYKFVDLYLDKFDPIDRSEIKTNDLIDAQLLISKDTSKSFKERGAAAEEIIRLTEELGKQEEVIHLFTLYERLNNISI